MNFELIRREEDLKKLTFDGIERVSVNLHRDSVSITNRVLGVIAGKEKVLEQLGKNTFEFCAKRRLVDLCLLSPDVDAAVPFMIIQVEEHWMPVLRNHVRHLLFERTHPHYVKCVLAAVPKRHAIQRITLYQVTDAIDMVPYMSAEQMAFLDCRWGLKEVQQLLSVVRPRLRHLFLEGIILKDPLDLKPLMDVFIQYFQRFVSNTVYADKDVLMNEAAVFRVDVRCIVPEKTVLPQFLLPQNLIVKLNGIVQETNEPTEEDQSEGGEEDSEEVETERVIDDIVPSKKRKMILKRRKESSEEVIEEEDVALKQVLQETMIESKEKSEEEEVVEEKSEEEMEKIVLPEEKVMGRRERKRNWSALEKFVGPEKIKKMNGNDPFNDALAKAASSARIVTCKTCKSSMSFRNLADHKRYCRKER